MATEVETKMKSHTMVIFWGGDERGRCVQITASGAYYAADEGFIHLTTGEAAILCKELSSFVKSEALRRRDMKDRVCDGCGEPLSPIATIDNSGNQTHWQGCESCERYTEGVPLKYFKVARQIVEEHLIVPYEHIKPGDEDYLVSQTAGVADILPRVEKLLSDFS